MICRKQPRTRSSARSCTGSSGLNSIMRKKQRDFHINEKPLMRQSLFSLGEMDFCMYEFLQVRNGAVLFAFVVIITTPHNAQIHSIHYSVTINIR